MADLGIIFLRRRYPIHWYQSSYIFITGSMPFCYFWATLYRLDELVYYKIFCFIQIDDCNQSIVWLQYFKTSSHILYYEYKTTIESALVW